MTEVNPPSEIDVRARDIFAALADVLIPAAGTMPAASEVGVHGRWLDRVLAARPALAEPLAALLDRATGREAAAEVVRLRAEEPDALEQLLSIVTNAYYMSPKVRKRLRYPGQKETPTLPDEADHYLRGGLLDPVIAREPIYRRAPETVA